MSLRETIEAAARNDERAVQSLLVEHLPSLEAFVRLQMGRALAARESLADLVQSVCVEVIRDQEDFTYRGDAAFRAWLFQRTLNKILNKHRHHAAEKRAAKHEIETPDDVDLQALAAAYHRIVSPSVDAMGREALEAFERAFASLPEDYRQAITLHRIVGLEYAEIARSMARSEGAVRNLVHRGLARLSLLLDDQ